MKFTPAYGYVKIKREIVFWHWYRSKKKNPFIVAMHLIFSVNHQENIFQNIRVLPGQTITSYEHIANETGLTFSQVRTAIKNLILTNDIAKVSTKEYTVIMLCNLRNYIVGDFINDIPFDIDINSQMTNNSQTIDKQIATNNNNINNINNNNNLLIKNEILKIENSKIFFQTISMKHRISKKVLLENFETFYNINYLEKNENFGPDQVKQHFANWIEKNIKKITQKDKKISGQKSTIDDPGYFINR